ISLACTSNGAHISNFNRFITLSVYDVNYENSTVYSEPLCKKDFCKKLKITQHNVSMMIFLLLLLEA
ncbi:unnamed protein product, partial [Schistosoma margrebowiei]